MTFWESILELRKQRKIPRQWTVSTIRPFLSRRFSEGTILSVPLSQSVTENGAVKGNLVRKGRRAMAFRLEFGFFELIDDPEPRSKTEWSSGPQLQTIDWQAQGNELY
jgi:hypothetical protein